jgi:hypothetical protein
MTQENNQNAVKHGGAGALKRIDQGKEFIGIARDAELAVEKELADLGRSEIVQRNAVRLQAVTDLYYSALIAAAQSGDVDQLTGLVAKYGWLASKALLAWDAVKKNNPGKHPGNIIDMLGGDNGQLSN